MIAPRKREWSDRRHYTWPELLTAVAHGDTPHWASKRQSESTTSSKSWDLGLGFDGALSLARGATEWPEGKATIEAIAREQAERFIAKRPFLDYGFDTTGEFFDVPSVIEGRPECWLRQEYSNTGAAALVRLVVDLGTSGSVPAHVIRDRMTAVCAAALTLEACGNPVEIVACDSSQEKTGGYLLSYQVATPGDSLDLTRLVALAHPAFFRRVVFRLIEQTPSPDVHAKHQYGYGECPRAIPNDVLAHEFGTHIVYIPPCPYDTQDLMTAEALLRIVKQRAGVVGSDDYSESEEI